MRKRLLALVLALTMVAGLVPTAAFAAEGDVSVTYSAGAGTGEITPATGAVGSTVTLDSGETLTYEGYAFGGWEVTGPATSTALGTVYDGGVTITLPEGGLELTAVWGQVSVELEVGEAAPAPGELTNVVMSSAGALGADVFNFSGVLDPSVTITSIRFADEAVTAIPVRGEDPYQAEIVAPEKADVVYARQIGAPGSNVVAYVQPAGDGYELVVAGDGGVTAAETQYWFAAVASRTETGATILTDGSGWNGKITSVDISALDTSHVQYFSGMFMGMAALTDIPGLEAMDVSQALRLPQLLYGTDLTQVDVSGWQVDNLELADFMFAFMDQLTSVTGLDSWNTSKLTSTKGMFRSCTQLSDFSGVVNWDVSSITNMSWMFAYSKLQDLDLTVWNPAAVADGGLEGMFAGCTNLGTIALDDWSMPNLTSAGGMFQQSTGSASGNMNVTMTGWNVPSLTSIYYIFSTSQAITADLSGWNAPLLSNMGAAFNGASKMTHLNLSGLVQSFSQLNNLMIAMSEMDALEWLDISGWTIDGDHTANKSHTPWYNGGSTRMGYVFGGPERWKDITILMDDWNITGGIANLGAKQTPVTHSYFHDTQYNTGHIGPGVMSAQGWNLNDISISLAGATTYLRMSQLNQEGDVIFGKGWTGLGGVNNVDRVFATASADYSFTELYLQGINIDNISSFNAMFSGMNSASRLMLIDFSGWTGTDTSKLSGMFTALPGDFTGVLNLVVTNDTIGQAIEAAFKTKMADLGKTETDYTVTYADGTQETEPPQESDPAQQTGRTLVETARSQVQTQADTDPTQTTDPDQGGDGAEQPAQGDGAYTVIAEDLWEHSEASQQGAEYALKATVIYTGDEGAQSDEIALTVTLPENMSVAEDPQIVTASFTDAAGETVVSGVVLTAAAIQDNTLTATLSDLPANSQIEISFHAVLSGAGTPSEDEEHIVIWEPQAQVTMGALSHTHTYRFWRAVPSISVSQDTLDFGTIQEGDPRPEAQEITITNDGGVDVEVNLSALEDYEITGDELTGNTLTIPVGETVTIQVQPKESLGVGSHNETLTITGPENVTAEVGLTFQVTEADDPSISVAQTTLDFGTIQAGSPRPEAQEITITNDGNVDLTLTLPTLENYEIMGDGLTGNTLTIPVGETVTIQVQPKEDLGVGEYNESLTITGDGLEEVAVDLTFQVNAPSGGGGGGVTPPGGLTITASVEGNGTISPSGVIPVTPGSSQNFTITPDEGYEIADVLVDGQSVGAVSSYTFTNITASHTIVAVFREAGGLADPDDTGVSDWLETTVHGAYLQGYGDGIFSPQSNMTRAEVSQMFYNLLLDKDVEITVSFTDVGEERWFAKAVNTLASLGILKGTGEGRFDPDSPITRAEFTAIAMRFTKGQVGGEDIFTDVGPENWYYGEVLGAVAYGWINGDGSGHFWPNSSITRAEVTAITNRMLGRVADRSYIDANEASLPMVFTDNRKSSWAYYDIVEATNGHDFTHTGGEEHWTGVQ